MLAQHSANNTRRKPSLLFIWNKDIRNPGAGGGTIELFAVMKWLANKGYPVTQVSGNFPGGKKFETIDGVNIVRLGTLYSMPFSLLRRQLLNRFVEKFDVIVEGLGYVSLMLPVLTRKPLLVICAHLPKEIFFIEGPTELGKPLGYAVATLARFVESVVTPRIYRNAKIFTFSKSSKDDMIETGFSEKNLFMVPYALAHYTTHSDSNLKQIAISQAKAAKSEIPTIVCIGRLRKYKGVQDLIRAVPKIKEEFPQVTVKILGRGRYEESLKKLASSLNVDQNVDFCGYVSVEEKFQLMASSQLLVMPSYREGFATPVFEAQMCGTIPVVSNAVGVGDLVVHGKTGLVFPRGDSDALAKSVVRLLKDRELCEHMRDDGFQSVMAIDWRNNEEKFLTLFEEKINEVSRTSNDFSS